MQPIRSSSRSILRISVVLVRPSTSAALRKLLYLAQTRNDFRSSQDASRISSVRRCVTAAPRCNSCCIPQIPARYGALPGRSDDRCAICLRKGPLWPQGTISIMLPTESEIEVQPARRAELSSIADMAQPAGSRSSDHGTGLAEIFRIRSGMHSDVQPAGKTARRHGVSLSQRRGHDALMLGEMNLTHPDIGLLAGPAMKRCPRFTSGRSRQLVAAWPGLGNVSAHLRTPPLRRADLFAQPSSADGRESDDRNRLRADPELSARSLALPAALESTFVQRVSSHNQQGVLQMHGTRPPSSRQAATRARSRSASPAIPTI